MTIEAKQSGNALDFSGIAYIILNGNNIRHKEVKDGALFLSS